MDFIGFYAQEECLLSMAPTKEDGENALMRVNEERFTFLFR